jgi:hypothetical protein
VSKPTKKIKNTDSIVFAAIKSGFTESEAEKYIEQLSSFSKKIMDVQRQNINASLNRMIQTRFEANIRAAVREHNQKLSAWCRHQSNTQNEIDAFSQGKANAMRAAASYIEGANA